MVGRVGFEPRCPGVCRGRRGRKDGAVEPTDVPYSPLTPPILPRILPRSMALPRGRSPIRRLA